MSCGIPLCGPSCSIPSCAAAPVVPLGSCGFGGYGGLGSGTSAASLGILSGAHVSCVNQLPPSEVAIQPSPVIVTIPGAILTSSCEPLAVGGYNPCASGSGGYGLGLGSCGYLGGGICRPRRKFSVCGSPC